MNISIETGQRRTIAEIERTWVAHIEGAGTLYGRGCTTRRNAVLSAAIAALSLTPVGAEVEVRRPACADSEEPALHARVLELSASRSVTWVDA